MSNWKIAFLLATAATGVTVSVTLHSQQPSTIASKTPAKAGSSQVHSIVLPQYPPEIAEGPNVETYSKNCLICHTARYVSMQPRFSKTVWQNEVKKMVDAYGAPVSEADQALIVEYLVAVKGVEAPARAATPPK
jgi:hypothetical protein